jgi:redox-sensitive bicupin YhaK (pirin superfamily)
MKEIRKVLRVTHSQPTLEGAGVHLKRAFGFREPRTFDPFLLLDDFRSDIPEHYLKGFPWHPHRGIETITYVLQGSVEHGDSMDNRGVISAGDVQWMTAGSGIIHQEMPQGDPHGAMYGFQLWANLPAVNKMMSPRYQEVKAEEIPHFKLENGGEVGVICGRVNSAQGPVQDIVTDPEYLDVSLPPLAQFKHPTRRGHTVLAYVIGGEGYFSPDELPEGFEFPGLENYNPKRPRPVGNESLVQFGDGEEVVVHTTDQALRFLLISGKPIGEPVAWYGPIVMNTQEELRLAFDELNKGTFIK